MHLLTTKRACCAIWVLLLSCFASTVNGHGGVSVEDDKCIMTIGSYRAHFTGYQPSVRASQEFCEDIPVVAESIIVLDFISQALREMAVEFRIVRDVANVGIDATYVDLGSPADIERNTMFHRPADHYPRGSVDVTIEFTEPGNYIGLLTALDDKSGTAREYVSVFPFSVGIVDWWARLKWIVICLVLGVGLAIWSLRKPRGNTDLT